MHLKKINTESNGYKAVRTVVSVVAGAGSGLTVECMSIPWVDALMKSKIGKGVCLMGVIPLATMASIAGHDASEAIIDAYAECWNMLADAVDNIQRKKTEADVDFNAKVTEKHDSPKDIPGPDATPAEEKKFIEEQIIGKYTPFEFDNIEKAQAFVEYTNDMIKHFGYVDLTAALYFNGIEVSPDIRAITQKFGWTADNPIRGVDQIHEHCYIVDAFNYKDISGVYQVLGINDFLKSEED